MKKLKHLLLGLACGVMFAAPLQATTPAGGPSIEELFKAPTYTGISLSPNGKFMAATVSMNDRQNLIVVDLEKRTGVPLTQFKDADVISVFWASDQRLIYTTGDRQGKEIRGDGGLFALDRDGKNIRTLVKPLVGGNAQRYVARLTSVIGRIPGNPEEVLVSANDRVDDTQDVYRMNIQTGRKQLITVKGPGKVARWILDKERTPRVTLSMDMEKHRWWVSTLEGDRWVTLAEWNENLENVLIPVAFDPNDVNRLYVASNYGRDTLAFFEYDLAEKKLGKLVFGDDRYDVHSYMLIGGGLGEGGGLIFGGSEDAPSKLIGVRYTADKPRTVWFDTKEAQVQASLDAALPGAINSFSPSRTRGFVRSASAKEPGTYYWFDQEKGTLEETGIRLRPWLRSEQLADMSYITWTARDGMKIGGYLTLPLSYRKGQRVPLVVHPHGGPWAKDNYGFNSEVQFYITLGYAVLQPNFRGSTGYGAKHLKASYKQWGAAMTDDIIDGVQHLVQQGIADPKRLAAAGASYGGYATLSVLTKRPDLFNWGFNYVGVTDMFVHQDTQPAQLYGGFASLAKVLNGDGKADKALFEAQSPTLHVEKLRAPVFHAYGGEDRNVDFANGKAIRAAMDAAKKPYEWMYVGDEAHGYRQHKNVMELYSRLAAFIKANTPPGP